MNDTHPEILIEPSRKVRWLLFLLSPKVAISLMILLTLLLAPFIYRTHRINQLPDIGDPFDVVAFGTVEISDEDNAFVEYREASSQFADFDEVLGLRKLKGDEYWNAHTKDR
jgi:hypothetical protein